MNCDNGNLAAIRNQEQLAQLIAAGYEELPAHLSPFAEEHMQRNPGKPVDLSGNSELARHAAKRRTETRGAFGGKR